MRKLEEARIKGKRVIVRVDFNVTIDPTGEIEDDLRIRSALPTIKYLLHGGAKKIILISHLGRPVIRPKSGVESIALGNRGLTLGKVAIKLADWLKLAEKVKKETIGSNKFPAYRLNSKISLLENIRFFENEEKNAPEFSQQLASLGDLFVNDAFAVCHREHASVVGITKYISSYAGFLVEKEIEHLSQLSQKPERPFVLIMGGAKILDKILVLKHLIKKFDYVLLGGVMANTFLETRRVDVKKSAIERDRLGVASDIFDQASRKIILPTDLVWDKDRIVDIGPGTIIHFQKIMQNAKTIFWNGTLGLTSQGMKSFRKGTEEIAKALAGSKAKTLVCGGDTIAEIDKLKLSEKISFISTGGGATLEYLSGEKLPGLEALE